jgi:uncharacterized Rossmann fold enzyme
MTSNRISNDFQVVVDKIGDIGRQRHTAHILEHAQNNRGHIRKSLAELQIQAGAKAESCILISAGPSVHRKNSIRRILDAGYSGTVIAVDGAYLACIRNGLVPDYVVTLDPHTTRVVRWFGDHDFEENSRHDDYFQRQDLDVEFRKNSLEQNRQNIALVDKYGVHTRALVATTAPANVVRRIEEARFDAYWWNPLVDDTSQPDSLTRQLFQINRLQCINTGGNVGGAAWVLASAVMKIPRIALVGMDFGYYADTPLSMTQTYHELIHQCGTAEGIDRFFCDFTFPLTGEQFYTDPTYYWYRKNFLQLLEKSSAVTVNCTEGGTLFGPDIGCQYLHDFLQMATGLSGEVKETAHG